MNKMAGGAILIDGNSLVYRAYFALPPLNDPQGNPTNALYGFLSMLFKVIQDEKPSYAAVAFDMHAPTFRHVRYADYKGTRAPTPDDLRPQFPMVQQVLKDMGICVMMKETYEADDLIGTASRVFSEADIPVTIVTGDRDSFQLTGGGVSVLYTKRGITDTERITEETIMERYGLCPEQLIDMKALCGDTSDNIPGVAGIGEKTAAKLIAKYGNLEECLERADKEEKGKLRERLIENKLIARECRFLAAIDRHVPIEFTPEIAKMGDLSGGRAFLKEHALNSMVNRLEVLCGKTEKEETAEVVYDLPEQILCEDAQTFETALKEMTGEVAVILTDDACSVACEGKPACMLELGAKTLLDAGLTREDAIIMLKALLTDSCDKIICSAKNFRTEAKALGIDLQGRIYDPSLAAYVLDSSRKSYDAKTIAADVDIEGKSGAAALFALKDKYNAELEATGVKKLFEEIETPLSRVLYDMETEGFRADAEALENLGKIYTAHITKLGAEIRQRAGHDINIQSPKQLAAFLYDELGIDNGRKGSDARTTNADVLEAIADKDPVIEKILEYRKYAKLNGTYIEGLLKLLRRGGSDGRIHTRFDQTSTTTGRLSSLEPNLQNIPVRTEIGRDIRKAFTAREGYVLVDADYSQIELRVLAHMAQDTHMIEAFRAEEDIHRRTAAEIYAVGMDEVTSEMRSAAKAVNFGIVYGISEFGLARNTGLTRQQASQFMKMYLARYPQIGIFMQDRVNEAKQNGYTVTMQGRRRYIKEFASANRAVRQFGERAAMNSPIQGTAADIIKMAMVRVAEALEETNARLILQVHDELIVEAPADEAEKIAEILKREMEGVVELDVPLKAEVSIGSNWLECK